MNTIYPSGKRLAWVLATILCMLLFKTDCFSQKIIFCETVDTNGKPSGISTAFTVSASGSFLNILVTQDAPLACSKVVFDIYRLDSLEKEKFESSTVLSVEPQWVWFNKGFTFYNPGDYVVYIYDESEKLIVAGKLKLIKN